MTDLPEPRPLRWTFLRKAAVCRAVGTGAITRNKACEQYSITSEELASWEAMFMLAGALGLRVTKLQDYSPVHHTARQHKLTRKRRQEPEVIKYVAWDYEELKEGGSGWSRYYHLYTLDNVPDGCDFGAISFMTIQAPQSAALDGAVQTIVDSIDAAIEIFLTEIFFRNQEQAGG